jgi:hypothetical protein
VNTYYIWQAQLIAHSIFLYQNNCYFVKEKMFTKEWKSRKTAVKEIIVIMALAGFVQLDQGALLVVGRNTG